MKKEISVAIAAIIVMSVFVGVVSAREGELSVYPDSWSETITAGEYETESFLVQNKAGFGDCPVKGIKVAKTSGPEWLTFTTSTDLGELKNVSFSRHFEIMIAPPIDVSGSFEYELRVSCTYGHPAYQDIRGRITVEPAVIPTPRPTLPPVETPTVGQVKISSSPEGARLHIDDKYYGETKYYSPEPIGLKAGTYTIKLTKEGYKDHTETITVKGGYIHKMTIILESLPVTPTETPATPTPTEPTQAPSAPAKAPLLTISQTILKEEPKVGEETLVKVSLLNRGGVAAKNILLSESIPSSVSVSHVSGAYSTGNIVTWSGELEPGKTHSIQHTFKMLEVKDRAVPVTVTYEDSDGNEYEASSTIYIATKEGVPSENIDSDGDGVPDEYDYAPLDPKVQTKPKTPGFEAVFAIAGLFAVAYLLRRRG